MTPPPAVTPLILGNGPRTNRADRRAHARHRRPVGTCLLCAHDDKRAALLDEVTA